MTSAADLSAHAGCWSDKRWRGRFDVRWRIIKDVLNSDLRHFRIMSVSPIIQLSSHSD